MNDVTYPMETYMLCRLPDVVLVSPEIAQNTGSIARTCAGLGVHLHLIEPLGFRLDSRYLKRAGLDYWPYAIMGVHRNWEAFLEYQHCAPSEMILVSTKGEQSLVQVSPEVFKSARYLVFGSETSGFPPSFYQEYHHRLASLPMERGAIRSYNVSVAVGMAFGVCLSRLSVSITTQ